MPDFQIMPACSTLNGWAKVNSVTGKIIANWRILDSNAAGNGVILPEAVVSPQTVYDLAASIRFGESKGPLTAVRAYGSLYSFSDAPFPLTGTTNAVSGATKVAGVSIDTGNLNASLQHLLPGILQTEFIFGNYFFVEAGVKLKDLDTMLDGAMPALALSTMGGTDGQSLAGAISTGTHGCDFDRSPLADCVQAVYLVGAGGVHYWIENSYPLTDPVKLSARFPCLQPQNIHYDTDMLNAVRVSFGSMGVIYAALIYVVPQYTLVQVNRTDTWEHLLTSQSQGGASADLSGAISGDWTGLNDYLLRYYGSGYKNRALQVVINPVKSDDGTHNCYVTNRAEVPPPYGGTAGKPPADLSQLNVNDLISALKANPHFGLGVASSLKGFAGAVAGSSLIDTVKDFVWFCEQNQYAWAVQAVIDYILSQALPQLEEQGPYTAIGHTIMASSVFASGFPTQSIASTEAFFDLPSAILYINGLLAAFDEDVDAVQYPAGYVSLRLCGNTSATLGQQRFSPTATVETSVLVTDNALEFIRTAERLALDAGGFLHWGQNNGSMFSTNVANTFGASQIQAWRQVQQVLGGSTFVNWFMDRLGLA